MVGTVSYDIENDAEFQKLLKKVSQVPSSRFVMGEAARIIKKFTKANFILKGSGQYAPLDPKYKKRKAKIKPRASILVFDGRLRDSLIQKTMDSILTITDTSLIIGTKVPYAIFLDQGTKFMPARKPFFLTKKMVEQIQKVLEAHIDKQLRIL
jgi:phage gpG-like protein